MRFALYNACGWTCARQPRVASSWKLPFCSIALPEVSIKIGVSTWTVSISVQRSITYPRLITYIIVKAIHLDAVGEGDIVNA